MGVKFLSDTKTNEDKAKLLFLKEIKHKQNFPWTNLNPYLRTSLWTAAAIYFLKMIWQIRNLGRVWSAETGCNQTKICWLHIKTHLITIIVSHPKGSSRVRSRIPRTIICRFKGLFLGGLTPPWRCWVLMPPPHTHPSFLPLTAHTYPSYSWSDLIVPLIVDCPHEEQTQRKTETPNP